VGDYFAPYVSAAERQRKADEARAQLRSRGVAIQPVIIEGRSIARTFWGRAWCQHLESFGDYVNRLPRGRTYVRNGSVLHLEIERGTVSARVQGSRLYRVLISIESLSPQRWRKIKDRCTGQIGSVLDLLQGRLSEGVMEVVTDRENGLFPRPREIRMQCSCPDWARMCKHIAAVLYGVGARLDKEPELLFLLRGVDHEELIGTHAEAAIHEAVARTGRARRIAESDLGEIFGVEFEGEPSRAARVRAKPPERHAVPGGISHPAVPRAGKKASPGPFPAKLTGRDVSRLRKRMGVTMSELARLLGMSPAAVSVWERKTGSLHLQLRTREALRKAWESAT
jgi:uncharacterized Zn finger protein